MFCDKVISYVAWANKHGVLSLETTASRVEKPLLFVGIAKAWVGLWAVASVGPDEVDAHVFKLPAGARSAPPENEVAL